MVLIAIQTDTPAYVYRLQRSPNNRDERGTTTEPDDDGDKGGRRSIPISDPFVNEV